MSSPGSRDRLRDDVNALSVLCARAAAWYSRERGAPVSALIVEKDFWVTEVLRVLSKEWVNEAPATNLYPVAVRAVFKGGTSLSKAHGLIQRFSEDIDVFLDLAPVPGSLPERAAAGVVAGSAAAPVFVMGKGRVDKIMKSAAGRVEEALGLSSVRDAFPREGSKRGFTFAYPRPEGGQLLGAGLKEGVILELVRMGTPTPNAPHSLTSMLSTWAQDTGEVRIDEFEEFAPFTMDVLAPERTLVDKLCILHGLGEDMLADSSREPGVQARHYYDVHQLLTRRSVVQSVMATPNLVADYAVVAAQESVAARRPGPARPEAGFASSPAFSDEVIDRAMRGYDEEMNRLALGAFPTLPEVARVVRESAALL